jgi:hypothetical protein
MALYTITVTNNSQGCDNEIEQQLTVTGCSTYIVRVTSNSNALGPFNVYVDSSIYYSAQTRTQMLNGVVVTFECPTPTMTPTPTITPTSATPTPNPTPTVTPTPEPTSTQTPTPTVTPTPGPTSTQGPTPTITPTSTTTPTPGPTSTQTPTPTTTPTPSPAGFSAYIFAEPQDFNDGITLDDYMTVQNTATWGGFQFYGTPSSTNYSSNLNLYAHFSGWTSGLGNYITAPQSFAGPIRQASGSGTDSYGCSQNQYTFGTIRVLTSQVNANIQYFYSIWVPLAGVGGSMTNMTVDIGSGGPCTFNLINDGIPDSIAGTNVNVTSGGAIPAGNYRVLWLGSFAVQPSALPPPPLSVALYFKGDTKT